MSSTVWSSNEFLSTESDIDASASPAALGAKWTSSVCDERGSSEMRWPEPGHENGVPLGIVTRTVAGRMPSLRSSSGSLAERSSSSLGNCSSGAPLTSERSVGCMMLTCGSVPSPTRSKSSCFVSATVPCSTWISKAPSKVCIAFGVK